jgi:thiol-disulfide isomerase/thioredoxin
MEAEGDEYVRTKRKAKDGDPQPSPYGTTNLDWAKAHEVERRPCGLTGTDHTCVVIEVPVKPEMRLGTDSQIIRLADGQTRLAIDSETGMLIQWIAQELIDNQRGRYEVTVTYSLKRMNYSTAPDLTLFKLPETGVHEVKELSRWNAARIKKQLVGKPAPDLQVTDMDGKPVSLADLKGKTILLDFWATWCPPCVADAPSLDKLYSKYGEKDLMIVGISVGEERETVAKFLMSHPHTFPVVLTSENEMPGPYQIGIFPTYMVIAPNGTLTTAVEGDQGFGELRKFLQKAGLETD